MGMELTTDIGVLDRAVYFSKLSASWNFDGSGNDRVGSFNDLISNGGAFYSRQRFQS